MTDTLHPRPQLEREGWIDLRGAWQFAYDDDNRGLGENWQEREDVFDRTIIVPFPPESPASGIGDPSYHPYVWYRRTFSLTPPRDGGRVLLHCGAVDYHAQVWVNGELVADHEGGSVSFSADVTDAVGGRSECVIVIRAEDQPGDLTQPRGKQDWREQPHSIWYQRTTGVWQPIWVETTGPAYIRSLNWVPDLDRGVLRLDVRIRRLTPEPLSLNVHLSLHGVPIADDRYAILGDQVQRDLALDLGSSSMNEREVLWSPRHPNLVEAVVTVRAGSKVLDEVKSYAGLRSITLQGGRFVLNGHPYYLRFALEQGYWPETHLAAPSDEALRREVELARELGFNGLRIHQKVEDPRFLYFCDKLGLLVWGEMANAYVFSDEAVKRLTREWVEIIERKGSHPCIVTWVPINESWGVPNLLHDPAQQNFVRTMYYLTKTLDPTRPVIGNDGWEYLVGDIFGIHDYTFDGDTIRERYGTRQAVEHTLHDVQPSAHFVTLSHDIQAGIPIMLTEFGGISYRPAAGSAWFGYGTVSDREAYIQKYEELVQAILDCPTIAGFCYTQLTDTAQETNGLLTENREPKIPPAIIREINRRPSMAVPADIIEHMRQVTGTPYEGGLPTPTAEDGTEIPIPVTPVAPQ